ncbi:hypothetical protein Mal52_02980 [Symmachiella dynata]|uniref:Uncharacterized protein n=1 Tax=Symmachiella dynata TaxID=2527995 RepID=A0A517ZH94_9PLAN|nr:hypothetical protein Mal52_02980 [Symmachiella dynata]
MKAKSPILNTKPHDANLALGWNPTNTPSATLSRRGVSLEEPGDCIQRLARPQGEFSQPRPPEILEVTQHEAKIAISI